MVLVRFWVYFHTFFKLMNNLFGSILDRFGPKSMAYSPWFWSFWVIFTPFSNYKFHLDFRTILGQKAWPIAHGFGRFWVYFHTFFKKIDTILNNIFHRFLMPILDRFGPKSMAYSPWFWSFWVYFHTFFRYELFIWNPFWTILGQKAWPIAHGFGHFGSIFTPFSKKRIIYLDPFWTILGQKAWPIAHGFGPILGHFHTFFKLR